MTTDNSDDRYTQFYDERGNGPDVIRMDVEPMPTVIERNCHLVFARSEDDDFHATRFVPGGYRLDDRSSQWLMGRLMLWMSGQLVFTGYKDAARNLPGPIDVAGIVDSVPDVLRVELRDALTAAIDAPRLAARETADAVEWVTEVDETVMLLRTSAGEWGVRCVDSGTGRVDTNWFTEERDARGHYADLCDKALGDALRALRIVAAPVDLVGVALGAADAEAFKALRFDCRRCGADLLGADLTTRADSDPDSPWQCPRCNHFAVEEIDAMTEATL